MMKEGFICIVARLEIIDGHTDFADGDRNKKLLSFLIRPDLTESEALTNLVKGFGTVNFIFTIVIHRHRY